MKGSQRAFGSVAVLIALEFVGVICFLFGYSCNIGHRCSSWTVQRQCVVNDVREQKELSVYKSMPVKVQIKFGKYAFLSYC